MASPLDVSKNPTRVIQCASEHSLETFKGFAITTVPHGYPVYLKLDGFLSMNLEAHTTKFIYFFQYLFFDELEFRPFYDEYMAVLGTMGSSAAQNFAKLSAR